jgi:hypothetical protein
MCWKVITNLQGAVQKLKVWLLEEGLSWSIWVGRVGDDNVKLVLVLLKELEAVSNVDLDIWVLEANGHGWQVLLGESDNSLINIAKDSQLDAVMLDNLSKDTSVTTTNNQDLLWVWVGVHGQVGDHLLVAARFFASVSESSSLCGGMNLRELVSLSGLDDAVENKNISVVGGFEDQDLE